MVFGAGLGTRMGALTADRPKPLIEVGGRALIDHALALVSNAGLSPVVNVHYRADQMRAHLAGRGVVVADETARLLETGGGLKAAMPLLGQGPVATLNSDAVWAGENPLRDLLEAWDPVRMEGLLVLLPRDAALGHTGPGDFLINSDGRLSRGPGHVYSGAQILRTEGLSEIAEEAFSLNILWDQMMARRTLFGLVYGGRWCDVGRPESIALAEDLLAHVPQE
jgi:MurNAc alpha-1-phosphate uridylyltransferase